MWCISSLLPSSSALSLAARSWCKWWWSAVEVGDVSCVEAGVVDAFGHIEMGIMVMVEAIEMDALILTQENNIKLHKSKDVQKYTNPQNPTRYMFVLAR